MVDEVHGYPYPPASFGFGDRENRGAAGLGNGGFNIDCLACISLVTLY